MIYCFDLDGTLCSSCIDPTEATPILERINFVNTLHNQGHTIIIETARGSQTGIDWLQVTRNQLDAWGVKYHQLRSGIKIAADLYIDDRCTPADKFFADCILNSKDAPVGIRAEGMPKFDLSSPTADEIQAAAAKEHSRGSSTECIVDSFSSACQVFNKRSKSVPINAVYIGRPSKWGNPFTHLAGGAAAEFTVCCRAESILRYEHWINNNPELLAEAKEELKGKDLVCWCTPLPCHGDVLLRIANDG